MENIGQGHGRGQAGPNPLQVKDRELTKRRLVNAVGNIIREHGYAGLGINKIASEAQVDKKLIYRYFGSLDKLVEQYVIEKDYWILASDTLKSQAVNDPDNLSASISEILENQFDFFYSQAEMQQLIKWELNGSELMKSISVAREHLGDKFLQLTDDYFKGSNVNFRALGALLSAGIYYMVLHAPVTAYCGIDLNRCEDRAEVKRTIRQVIRSAFDQAKSKKNRIKNGN